MKTEASSEIVAAITKASPPISIAAMVVGGVSLQDWVLILTAIYTVLQIGFLLYGKYKVFRNGR